MGEPVPADADASAARTDARRPVDWRRITRTLADAVRRAQRLDPEEYEAHA